MPYLVKMRLHSLIYRLFKKFCGYNPKNFMVHLFDNAHIHQTQIKQAVPYNSLLTI